MIVMIRADDRLMHGMVAVSWTSALKPDRIMVVNDEVANDQFKSMTMKLAKPAGVEFSIKTKEAAIPLLKDKYAKINVFVVTASVADALYVYENVPGVTKVNIGTAGVSKKPGDDYRPTLPNVFMTPHEFECARKMHDAGCEVWVQITPSQERLDFNGISKSFMK